MLATIEQPIETSAGSPVCLWQENPYRLVSLLDMLRFYADKFCRCSSLLGQMFVAIRNGETPIGKSFGLVGSELRRIEKDCEEAGLVVTLAQIKRVHQLVETDILNTNLPFFGQELIQIQTRLNDELEARLFFSVPQEKAKFYHDNPDPYGASVAQAFPSILFDATEANKCFALGRATACVFHLMRVLEIGLSVLAAKFSIPSGHTNWHNIIEGVERAVRNMGADPAKPADWKDQQEFYSQVANHFMIFKDAWRNYTAHARGKYTDEEAGIIMANTQAFIQKLATRLHE